MGILRIFLALCVVAAHCGCTFLFPSNYAVECFYVISGFYMSLILNEKYADNTLLFWKKRALRLIPPYWILATIALFVSFIITNNTGASPSMLYQFDGFRHMSLPTKIGSIFSNIFLFGQDNSLFFAINPETGNPFFSTNSYAELFPCCRYYPIEVAWSVSLELCFYLVAPLFIKKNWKVVVCVFLCSIAIKFGIRGYWGLNNENWTYRFFPSEIAMFCLGYFSYKIYTRIRNHKVNKVNGVVLLIAIILGLNLIPLLNLGYSASITLISILIVPSIAVLFSCFKNSKFDKDYGNLSYLIYLAHMILISIIRVISPSISSMPLFAIATISTIAFCYFLQVVVIDKIEMKRNNLK